MSPNCKYLLLALSNKDLENTREDEVFNNIVLVDLEKEECYWQSKEKIKEMGRSFLFIDSDTLICEDIDYVKTYKILQQDGMLEISKGKLVNLEGKTNAKSLIGVT